ncbi:MAG: hypothetical protein Q4F84_01175 [Fibrobacter sp.]|nr:hypothetical protein [Fibrobacter sp.]
MLKIKKIFSRVLLVVGAIGCLFTPIAGEESPADSAEFKRMLDSLGLTENDLESKVRSTLMFGGSSPVSFSGEARLKMQYHQMKDPPVYLDGDKSYIQSNWEGNESFYRMGMVARAGRNAVLWSKIGFQHTLPGTFIKEKGRDTLIDGRHDKANEPAIIHEDMSAGLAIRTVPVSFWLKMGAVHWIEASPLTIWKSQPRTFAWEYLPFEVEQPIARYYEYNIAKGEKSGRAAWNKKAFQGINLESINLPSNLYLNFLSGTYERYDNFEREYFDFSNDLAYAGESSNSPAKGKGLGDSYRHVFFGRLAKTDWLGGITPALNLLVYKYDDNVLKLESFKKIFGFNKSKGGRVFYKEPIVSSLELRGAINDKLKIHADLGFSSVDTNWATYDTVRDSDTSKLYLCETKTNTHSKLKPAFYTRIESEYGVPIRADIAVISQGYYSPLSFAVPADAFYPFESNLVGPGKFLGRGEASPYAQNMAGVNLLVAPKLSGYGHLKVTYGQHFQLKSAQDVIYFPYRLNGQDLFSMFHSSYTRWGNDAVDHPMATSKKYTKRLGDESYKTTAYGSPVGGEGGALRSDYMSIFESFVPYQSAEQADSNMLEKTTVYTKSKWVPQNQKFTFNLTFDYAYDLGALVGYDKDLFFSIYATLNGVSTSFKPIAFNSKDDDMLLFGTYVRMEPAIALSNKFYILGLLGFEMWNSDKAYINAGTSSAPKAEKMGIDYRDYAVGIGFDWDMLSRVGLHGRIKYMQHDDINIPANNYKTPVVSTEIKLWF